MQFNTLTPTAPTAPVSCLPSPVSSPAPAAPARPGRINLGAIKTAAAKPGGKTYPIYPADQPTKSVASWIIDNLDIPDKLDAAKKDLANAVTPFYFQTAHGRGEVESSVAVPSTTDKELLIVYPKQLVGSVLESAILPILGPDRTTALFRPTFEIKIDGDKIPAAAAQDLVNELCELFAKHNAIDALSQKEKVVPTDVFHLTRHTALTVEENLALNQIARIKTMTKLRK